MNPLQNEPNFNTANDIESFIKTLIQYQAQCEKAAEYIQAEAAQKRISELKKLSIQKKRKEMQYAHQQQEIEIERAHLEEFNQLNNFWDQKLQKFSEEAHSVEQELYNRQQNEHNTLNDNLERTIPIKPKESSELLNLRKREEYLAKQKNYVEAQKVKEYRLELEEIEYSRYQIERTNKIIQSLKQLKTKHQNETNALLQRIKGGQEQLQKNKQNDLERQLQKYQNTKKELEAQQKMETLTFDGSFINKGKSNQSIYMSQIQ